DPFPIVALDRALDREHFTSVVGADQDDAEMLAEELRKFPAETVLYLGALPELSVSFLREQGFRTAWKDDPREVHFGIILIGTNHAGEVFTIEGAVQRDNRERV
ncbi:hypothetical protein ACUOA5_51415, partial [Escherichia coli]